MLAHTLWRWMNAGAARRFRLALRDPSTVQAQILSRYLRANAGTTYGKLRGFERVRTAREFQERVPVTRYEDYAPFVERIAAGEQNVLTAERVLYFAPT